MKNKITFLLTAVLLTLASVVYAEQVVVLDPVTDYEFNLDAYFSIPIGATFMEPINDGDIFVEGLAPGMEAEIRKISPFRISGKIVKHGETHPGDYFITIMARDHLAGATSSAAMRLRLSGNREINAPVIFDPIEQVKTLKVGRWYSIAIGASDSDQEGLLLNVTGAAENGLGYAVYKTTEADPGRIGGVLLLKMYRPGELKINLSARDKRAPVESKQISNKTTAELHFLVVK